MFDTAPAPAIELSNLRYEAHGKVLIDIADLKLGRSGITVIMGPNGAGKSVMLRLLHGLLTPENGTIHCYRTPLDAEVARQQALVFQTPVLLRRSVEANIRFVLRARKNKTVNAAKLLEKVGLAGMQHTPARRLSGGERQRLALALALATEPRLMFLDEPTASLDPASVLAIEDIVRDAASKGMRILFVTHDAGQARRLADDVVFLSGGKVLEHTPAGRFFDTPETRAAQDYLAGRLTPTEV